MERTHCLKKKKKKKKKKRSGLRINANACTVFGECHTGFEHVDFFIQFQIIIYDKKNHRQCCWIVVVVHPGHPHTNHSPTQQTKNERSR
jgi:hypothetical protein